MLDNIKTPEELYAFIKSTIKYGFVSSLDNKIYKRKELNNDELYDNNIYNYYYIQDVDEILKNKCGICYDQVELVRYWFKKNNYEVHTYFSSFHHHAFLIYKDDDKYCLFETSLPKYNGIYKESSLKECLYKYKEIQEKLSNEKLENVWLYEYQKVKKHTNFFKDVCGICKTKKGDINI